MKMTTGNAWIAQSIPAPIYQQAFRWFREKGIYGDLTSDLSDNLEDRVFVYYIYSDAGCYYVDRSKEYKTYEMAELACLKELIEIVKEKKNDEDDDDEDYICSMLYGVDNNQ